MRLRGPATPGHPADRRGRGRLRRDRLRRRVRRDRERALHALAPGPARGHGGARAGGDARARRARRRSPRAPAPTSPTSRSGRPATCSSSCPVGGAPGQQRARAARALAARRAARARAAAGARRTAPRAPSWPRRPASASTSCPTAVASSCSCRIARGHGRVDRAPRRGRADRRPRTAPSARCATSSCSRARSPSLAALTGGFAVASRVAAPLRRMARVAARVDAGDLGPRMEIAARHDEVRVLAEAFDHMLDRLEDAFDRQTAFVADASHELRTPLTVIRGQLEVLALADQPDAAEVRRVEKLVALEVQRMSRLVEDMLLLAQAGEDGFLRPGGHRAAAVPDRPGPWPGGRRPAAAGARRDPGAADRGRRGTPGPGAAQPPAQRDRPHRRGRRWSSSASRPRRRSRALRRRRRRPRASRSNSAPRSSTASIASTGAARATPAGPGWGSRSSRRSPRPTAAASGPRRRPAGGARMVLEIPLRRSPVRA